MELKDIILKKGDKVYFDYGVYFIDSNEDGKKFCNIFGEGKENMVSKIGRLKGYETIYEAPKEILTKEEKEYLEHFLRPFRDEVKGIIKKMGYETNTDFIGEYLAIGVKNCPPIYLPYFKQNKYYKGMELNKEYTLEELGLFKE